MSISVCFGITYLFFFKLCPYIFDKHLDFTETDNISNYRHGPPRPPIDTVTGIAHINLLLRTSLTYLLTVDYFLFIQWGGSYFQTIDYVCLFVRCFCLFDSIGPISKRTAFANRIICIQIDVEIKYVSISPSVFNCIVQLDQSE